LICGIDCSLQCCVLVVSRR